MQKLILGIALAAMLAFPAQARWRVAESDHFVIYADDSEADLLRFGDQLERYHSAIALLTGREEEVPSPSNRLTVYVAGNERDIRRLANGDRTVAGFYIPHASGSRAFVQNIYVSRKSTDFSMTVLLHEYAHHFLISTSRHALPRWLSEGAAEFYASARFPKDGQIEIGRPAQHRAVELLYGVEVPLSQVFEPATAGKWSAANDFYGRSWLLFHYLTFGNEERRGQLASYWRSVASGTSSLDAARQAFGDLDTLASELADYLRRRRMTMAVLPAEELTVRPVRVRELSDGMNAVIDLMMVSKRGVTSEQAAELLPEIRDVASRFPRDPGVLAALAEAEFDAGNDVEAIAAADAALSIDPSKVNAYLQKGYALFRQAAVAEDAETAYDLAMQPFQQLNRIENDHPMPLIYLYRSYSERGLEPSETARHALERASELAPFDKELAMELALMQAQDGNIARARMSLGPVLANPHGGNLAEEAQRVLAMLADAPEGEPVDPVALARARTSSSTGSQGTDGPVTPSPEDDENAGEGEG